MEDQLQSLARQLTDLTETLRNDGAALKAHSAQLSELSRVARDLTQLTRGPMEYMMEILSALTQIPALGLLTEWGAFRLIPRDDAISYEALAEKLDADTALITRLMWVLVSCGVLRQVDEDKIAHTPFSTILFSGHFDGLLQTGMEDHLRGISNMPAYFAKYGRREPTGQRDTIYAFALGDPSLTVWEHMNRNERLMKNFMKAMSGITSAMCGVEAYDFNWVVEAGKEGDPERALVVDVGGGRGHALESIGKATPGLDMTRCVLEDTPVVLDEAKREAQGELAKAQFVSTDFHSEQPVRGALAYHIRRCLHDYSDDDCVRILRHIREAMRPDSVCLIVEGIMDNPPSTIDASNDIIMAVIGGKERTLEMFRSIVSRAGLEVKKLHKEEGAPVGVIECVVV